MIVLFFVTSNTLGKQHDWMYSKLIETIKCYKLKQTHLDKKKMNPKTRPLQLHVPGVDPFMVDIVNVLCLVPANQNSFLNLSPFFSKFIAKQYFHLLRTSGI